MSVILLKQLIRRNVCVSNSGRLNESNYFKDQSEEH